MDRGRVAGPGSHDDLMAGDGRHASRYRRQGSGYR
jgi:ABC-type multidrug transport system fused ATPase/permease subunit